MERGGCIFQRVGSKNSIASHAQSSTLDWIFMRKFYFSFHILLYIWQSRAKHLLITLFTKKHIGNNLLEDEVSGKRKKMRKCLDSTQWIEKSKQEDNFVYSEIYILFWNQTFLAGGLLVPVSVLIRHISRFRKKNNRKFFMTTMSSCWLTVDSLFLFFPTFSPSLSTLPTFSVKCFFCFYYSFSFNPAPNFIKTSSKSQKTKKQRKKWSVWRTSGRTDTCLLNRKDERTPAEQLCTS